MAGLKRSCRINKWQFIFLTDHKHVKQNYTDQKEKFKDETDAASVEHFLVCEQQVSFCLHDRDSDPESHE